MLGIFGPYDFPCRLTLSLSPSLSHAGVDGMEFNNLYTLPDMDKMDKHQAYKIKNRFYFAQAPFEPGTKPHIHMYIHLYGIK